MMTLIVFLVFIGFYCCYFSSERAILHPNNAVELWLKIHRKTSEYIGYSILILTLLLSINNDGFASGIFIFLITLMVSASLIIVLTPLKIFNSRSAIITFLFLAGIEISNII